MRWDMRRIVAGLVVAGALANQAASAPPPAPAAAPAPAPDLSPAHVALTLPDVPPPRRVHPVASAAILGGVYLAFSSWAYLAWYAKHKPLGYYKWGGDGWLGDTTYAGGADKFGHAWATMSLARAGTLLLLEYGGYDRLQRRA